MPTFMRGERATRLTVVGSLVAYALLAVALRGWWLSAVVAGVVAVLLWRRHSHARFSAYIFFSALALRGVLAGAWLVPAYAVVAIALLQTAGARQAWPRLARRGNPRAG